MYTAKNVYNIFVYVSFIFYCMLQKLFTHISFNDNVTFNVQY